MAGTTTAKGLNAALLAVQQDAPELTKDAQNPHFGNRYLSLAGLVSQVLPILHTHGVLVIQQPTFTPAEQPALTTKLVHVESGEEIEATMLLVLGEKKDPQAQGSALTYARRYALMSMLSLVADEDDDGNRASRRQASSNGHKASEKTVTKIRALRSKLVKGGAFTEEQFQTGIYESYGVHKTEELTQTDASDLIPRLEAREKELTS